MAAIAVDLPAASGVLSAKPSAADRLQYNGYSVCEKAASPAAAKIRIRVATSSGQILSVVTLAASGSKDAWFGPEAIDCRGDLYLEIVSGEVEGVAYVK